MRRRAQQAAADGVRVANDKASQSQAQYKYAQTGPQQVAAQTARAKQAEAQVQQAQAQLDQANLNLSYTKIVAPAAGIITRKSVEMNQNVSIGSESADAGFARRYLGDCELQGNPAEHMDANQAVEIQSIRRARPTRARSRRLAARPGRCCRCSRRRTRPATT